MEYSYSGYEFDGPIVDHTAGRGASKAFLVSCFGFIPRRELSFNFYDKLSRLLSQWLVRHSHKADRRTRC